MAKAFALDAALRITEVLGLDQAKAQITQALQGAGGKVAITPVITPTAQAVTTAAGATAAAFKPPKPPTGATPVGLPKPDDFNKSKKAADDFGQAMYLAGKRYAAFVAATAAGFKAWEGIRQGTEFVMDFQDGLLRLDQIMMGTAGDLSHFKGLFRGLAVDTGGSQIELAKIAATLSEAGYAGKGLEAMVRTLSRIPLLPTFKDVEGATDGLIAILNQFNLKGEDSARVIDMINYSSKRYAFESQDVIEAVRRGGSAWAEMGGTLEEFIAVMGTIRERTRQSAASIGTAMKTITGRMARPQTLEYLEQSFGIRTRDEKGDILTAGRLFEEISKKYVNMNLQERRAVGELLGGYRQIGNVLAELGAASKTAGIFEALKQAPGSSLQDAEKAIHTLSRQVGVLRAEWNNLIDDVSKDTFEPAIKGMLGAGHAAIFLLDHLKPLLPVLTAAGAAWIGIQGVGLGKALVGKVGGLAGPTPAGGLLGAMGLMGLLTTPIGGAKSGPSAAWTAGNALRQGKEWLGGAPVTQVALLAAAGVAGAKLAEFGTNAAGASKATSEFVNNLVKCATIVAAVATVLQGRTVAQTIAGGGLPGLGTFGGKWGALGMRIAGGATLLAGAAAYAGYEQQKAMRDEILENMTQGLKRIEFDFPASDTQGLQDAASVFIQKQREALSRQAETLNWTASNVGIGETVARLSRAVGKKVVDVLAGTFELGTIGPQDAKNTIAESFKRSGDKVAKMIESAMVQGGAGFRDVLIENFTQGGMTAQGAKVAADAMVEVYGGFEHGLKQVGRVQKEERDRLTREQGMRDTAAFVGSHNITFELLEFERAIKVAVGGVKAFVGAFEAQVGVLGEARAPVLPREFGETAIRDLIRSGGMTTGYKNTDLFIRQTAELRRFTNEYAQRLAEAVRQGGGPAQNPVFADKNRMEAFIADTMREIEAPQQLRPRLEAVFKDINEDLLDGANILSPGIIEDRFTRTFTDIANEEKRIIELVTQRLQGIFVGVTREMESYSMVRGLEAQVPVRGSTQMGYAYNALARVGIDRAMMGKVRGAYMGYLEGGYGPGYYPEFQRPAGWGVGPTNVPRGAAYQFERFDVTGAQSRDLASDRAALDKLIESRTTNTQALSEVTNSLYQMAEGTYKGNQTLAQLQASYRELSKQSIDLSVAEATYKQTLKRGEQFELQQAQRDLADELARFDEETVRMRRSGQYLNPEDRQERREGILFRGEQRQYEITQKYGEREEKLNQLMVDRAKIMDDSATKQSMAADTMFKASVTLSDAVNRLLAATPTGTSQPVIVGPATTAPSPVAVQSGGQALLWSNPQGGTERPVTPQAQTQSAEATDRLAKSLDQATQAWNNGGRIVMETQLHQQVNVTGLGPEVETAIRSKVEGMAQQAAVTVLNRALDSLARNSENPELRIAIQRSRLEGTQ